MRDFEENKINLQIDDPEEPVIQPNEPNPYPVSDPVPEPEPLPGPPEPLPEPFPAPPEPIPVYPPDVVF